MPPSCALDRIGTENVAIRVLLGQMPGMLRDILRDTVRGHDDLEVVGVCDSAAELGGFVDRSSPDVVVVGMERQESIGVFVALFRDHPDLRLLVIRNDARSAALHQLRFRRCRVTDVSPAAILAALRAPCDESEAAAGTNGDRNLT
jgi:DNA-binding NarL/FixJ family response regulator